MNLSNRSGGQLAIRPFSRGLVGNPDTHVSPHWFPSSAPTARGYANMSGSPLSPPANSAPVLPVPLGHLSPDGVRVITPPILPSSLPIFEETIPPTLSPPPDDSIISASALNAIWLGDQGSSPSPFPPRRVFQRYRLGPADPTPDASPLKVFNYLKCLFSAAPEASNFNAALLYSVCGEFLAGNQRRLVRCESLTGR